MVSVGVAAPLDWPPSHEGEIPFVVDGETHYTWYRTFGTIQNSPTIPLVVLHGGPGFSHDYLLPISDLSTSRPVIFYDQIGNSRSTHLPHKPTSFWSVDLFIDELVNVLKFFNIQDRFTIVGHSWGGILALEFIVRRQPEGLKSLILSNSLAAMRMWNESNAQLNKGFSEEVQAALKVGMSDPNISGPAMKMFRQRHGCRLDQFPYEYNYTLDRLFSKDGDTTVARAMFGGPIKDWDVIDKLHLVKQPTFAINGRYDPSQDWLNEPFFQRIPKIKWVTLENSSHTPFWEERKKYIQLVNNFLNMFE